MKEKRKWIWALILIPAFLCHTSAAEQSLTMEALLAKVKQNNPVFKKKELTVQMTRERLQGLTQTNQWQFSAEGGFNHVESAVSMFGIERTDAWSGTAEIHRHFWKTGGQWRCGYAAGRTYHEWSMPLNMPDEYTESKIFVQYVQPLLKNWRGKISSLSYETAKFDSAIVALESNISENQISAKAAEAFLRWTLLEEEVRILVERNKLSEELLGKTKQKLRENLVDKIDLIRAEDAVRFGRLNIETATAELEATRRSLVELACDSSVLSATPDFGIYALPKFFDTEEIGLYIDSTYMVKSLRVRKEQFKIVKNGLLEGMKPELNALFEANTKNGEYRTADALKMDKPDYRVGLSFSMPIGRKAERANVRANRLQQRELGRQVDEIKMEISASTMRLLTQQKAMAKALETSKSSILSAEEITVEELKRYRQGRSVLAFVIMSRDDKLNAMLTHARQCASIHQLQLQIKALLNLL